jgi:hypothetical protein
VNAASSDEDHGSCCPACERQVSAGARFCPGCGRSVSDEATIASGCPTAVSATAEGQPDPSVTGAMAPVVMPAASVRDDRRTEAARQVGLGGPGTSTCPSCGAANMADRMLCGACGLDLATGDPQLTVAPCPAADWTDSGAPTADDGHAHAIQWWVPALAGIAVLVGVAIAIVVLGLGPFAPSTDVPPAEFEAATYPGEPEVLTLTDIATLTFQAPAAGRTFTSDHLVDGDATTAWHGDADALPAGTDEKIDLFLDQPAWVAAVVIENGDQRDAEAYASTSRVQRAILIFDGDVRVPVTLLDQGLTPQIVELEEPLLSAAVRIEIVDTVAGMDLEEVALTRLQLLGYPAQGTDVALAEERAALVPAAGAITLPA